MTLFKTKIAQEHWKLYLKMILFCKGHFHHDIICLLFVAHHNLLFLFILPWIWEGYWIIYNHDFTWHTLTHGTYSLFSLSVFFIDTTFFLVSSSSWQFYNISQYYYFLFIYAPPKIHIFWNSFFSCFYRPIIYFLKMQEKYMLRNTKIQVKFIHFQLLKV